jgi:hypothetical protein
MARSDQVRVLIGTWKSGHVAGSAVPRKNWATEDPSKSAGISATSCPAHGHPGRAPQQSTEDSGVRC